MPLSTYLLGRPMKHGTALRHTLCTTLTSSSLVLFVLTLLGIASACVKPPGVTSAAINKGAHRPDADALAPPPGDPISQFVRRIHEDRRGHMWLGTNGDGVARWNGEALEYFSLAQGFSGVAVRAIVEGADGSVWFGTEGGLTKFDGASFTNYTVRDGLVSDDVWCLAFDRRGELWVGTLQGVCRFDGARFTPFELPEAEPDPTVTEPRINMLTHSDFRDRLSSWPRDEMPSYTKSDDFRPSPFTARVFVRLTSPDSFGSHALPCVSGSEDLASGGRPHSVASHVLADRRS